MPYLSKQQFVDQYQTAPPGTTPAQAAAALIKNGYTIEGLNDSPDTSASVSPDVTQSTPQPQDQGGGILGTIGGFASDLFKGLTKPLVTSLARPIQLEESIRTGTTPTFDLPYYGKIEPPKEGVAGIKEALGTGLQTAGLGLGPVAGGAAFGAGQALEADKSLPAVAGYAAGGAALGKAGDLLFQGLGKVAQEVGGQLRTAGAGEGALRTAAEKQYAQVLAPTTKVAKDITEKTLAPGLADRGLVAFSRKGLLTKAEEQVAGVGEKLNAAWEGLPKDTQAKVNPILKSITTAQNSLEVKGTGVIPDAVKGEYSALTNLKDELLSMSSKGNIPADSLRSYRQILDSAIQASKKGFGLSISDGAKLSAQKTMANAIRTEFSKQFPDIAAVNKEFSFWANLEDVLSQTITRTQGQASSMGEKIATGAGVAAGLASGGISKAAEAGVMMKYLSKAINSTAWRTTSAAFKSSLADAIAKGDSGVVKGLIQKGLGITGDVLEKGGEIVSGIPKALKELPRKDIPTSAPEAFGLSIQDVSKKGSPTMGKIAQELEPLVQEARKYKTAEEFVKAQGTPTFSGSSEITKEWTNERIGNFGTIYRGRNELGGGIYITDSPEYAKTFGSQLTESSLKNNLKLFDVRESSKAIGSAELNKIKAGFDSYDYYLKHGGEKLLPTDHPDEILNKIQEVYGANSSEILKKAGFDGIVGDESRVGGQGGTVWNIFDAKNIKTKSQLTDIWNKANKK